MVTPYWYEAARRFGRINIVNIRNSISLAGWRTAKMGYLALASILLVAGFLRFSRLDAVPPGLADDEAVNGNDALQAWRTGKFRVFYPQNYGREGLFINLQALTLGIIGRNEPWVLRLPSAILGSLTVWGMYFAAKRIIGRTPALWAAFLAATSFWQIQISRLGTRPVASLFFLVWALVFFFKSVELWQRRSKWWPLIAAFSGVLYGLGFHTYTAYRITPLLVAGLVWQMARRHGAKPILRLAAIVIAAAVLTALPLAAYAYHHPEDFFQRVRQLKEMSSVNPEAGYLRSAIAAAKMLVWSGDMHPRHNIPGRPVLFWPAGILFVVGVTIAMRRQKLLLWWMAVGALPAIIANEGSPHALRSLLMAPAVFMLTAMGVDYCGGWLQRLSGWFTSILGGGLALLLLAECYQSFFILWPKSPRVAATYDQSLIGVARRLDSLPREIPKYVIFAPDGVTFGDAPFGAQPIMFLTDTFTRERQQEKNIFYLRTDQTNQIARGYVYVHYIDAVWE
jgi:4-amino-4-deoxy-L-arabinose transferase-like glycosyltransferase